MNSETKTHLGPRQTSSQKSSIIDVCQSPIYASVKYEKQSPGGVL